MTKAQRIIIITLPVVLFLAIVFGWSKSLSVKYLESQVLDLEKKLKQQEQVAKLQKELAERQTAELMECQNKSVEAKGKP